MASIRKQGATYEIRECRATPAGPRQFALARFQSVLTPEALDEAALRARRPFDRDRVLADARARGIPTTPHRRHEAARKLLGELRSGRPLEPSLVALLKQALADREAQPLPEHLEDAAEWVGRSETGRGRALRGLLRAASRVVHSRGDVTPLPDEPFPRFSSTPSSA
ncbi:MAG: hypothetical protein QNK05_09205 [Myxococcota bacterium]|nr:hypothetical protein [Myxococcota bacterium]